MIGWIFLNETYSAHQWTGMFVTLSGVSVVILERSPETSPANNRKTNNISFKGVAFAVAGMVGQAGGYVLSKSGMQTESGYLDPFSATQIRAIAAFVCFFFFMTLTHKWREMKNALTNTKAVAFTTVGAAIGPFLGVSLSLMALHYLTAGVASTYLSLVPICIIPFSIFLHKEHVSMRAFAGAVTAVFGIYLLMN